MDLRTKLNRKKGQQFANFSNFHSWKYYSGILDLPLNITFSAGYKFPPTKNSTFLDQNTFDSVCIRPTQEKIWIFSVTPIQIKISNFSLSSTNKILRVHQTVQSKYTDPRRTIRYTSFAAANTEIRLFIQYVGIEYENYPFIDG